MATSIRLRVRRVLASIVVRVARLVRLIAPKSVERFKDEVLKDFDKPKENP
jgi:hypothetical protein